MSSGNIIIKRGDTFRKNINFKDSTGAPINITGWTIWFTIRKSIGATSETSDSGSNVVFQQIVTDGDSSGIVSIIWDNTDIDAKPYYYDIQIKKMDNSIVSSDYGSFTITNDITRAR